MAKSAKLRALLAPLLGCFLAIAVLLPTIDTCICATDLMPGMLISDPVDITSVSEAALHNDADLSVPCVNCHCSHWVGLGDIERPALGTGLTFARASVEKPDAPVAGPTSELLRPPRG